MESKNKLRLHRKRRVRAVVSGVADRPRLAVFRSLHGVYAQLIDDTKGVTVAQANFKEVKGKGGMEKASAVGELIAERGQKKKITNVVFDRAGYKYHGKVRALAEGARKGGLKF